ncbi:hypothetical protein KS2013_1321 [Kangiella sediminilitoris]|uniref:Uncharacterized protein n=1 Tax=Kangiella sediminilitoris TaxID=1144748 RepID=A0A1B3BB64_9GAMM|nr:hypothetical protein KS2013_1321 [Kangiella sediminilitoris]
MKYFKSSMLIVLTSGLSLTGIQLSQVLTISVGSQSIMIMLNLLTVFQLKVPFYVIQFCRSLLDLRSLSLKLSMLVNKR